MWCKSERYHYIQHSQPTLAEYPVQLPIPNHLCCFLEIYSDFSEIYSGCLRASQHTIYSANGTELVEPKKGRSELKSISSIQDYWSSCLQWALLGLLQRPRGKHIYWNSFSWMRWSQWGTWRELRDFKGWKRKLLQRLYCTAELALTASSLSPKSYRHRIWGQIGKHNLAFPKLKKTWSLISVLIPTNLLHIKRSSTGREALLSQGQHKLSPVAKQTTRRKLFLLQGVPPIAQAVERFHSF